MAWTQIFIDSLDSPSTEIHYALKFLPPSNDYSFGQGDYVGMNTIVHIGNADVTIDTVQVTPQRWSVNFGGFTLRINGDLRPLLSSSFRKGAVAELIMFRNGMRMRVCVGQLRSITGGRGVWTVQFVDFLTLMRSRLTTKINESAFWFNAGKTAKVTVNFNFSSSTRLYLDDITMFEKETGQNGKIKVEHVSSGAIDYWTWSSKTTTSAPAGYLTIATTGNYPNTGLAITTLSINDVATSIARLRGRPDYVFARLVMSTGQGTQGAFDDYPASWGLGVEWNPSLFNLQSLNEYYNTVWKTATGTHEIELNIEQAGNIGSFLDAVLKMGMWPVWRQNELSWRVCQNPNQASYFAVVDHISDIDIISIDSHELYASSQSAVFSKSTITVYNSASSQSEKISFSGQSIATLPADLEIQRDLSLVYRVDSPTQPNQADADLARMRRWDVEPYEQLSITVTERHCMLTAGDIVEISSNYIYGLRSSAGSTYSNQRAMVLGVRWNPTRSNVNLTLGITT